MSGLPSLCLRDWLWHSLYWRRAGLAFRRLHATMCKRRDCSGWENMKARHDSNVLRSAGGICRSVLPPKHVRATLLAPAAVSLIVYTSPGCSVFFVAHVLRHMGERSEQEALPRTLRPATQAVQFTRSSPIFHPNYRALTKPLRNPITPCLQTTSIPNYTTADWLRLVKLLSCRRHSRHLLQTYIKALPVRTCRRGSRSTRADTQRAQPHTGLRAIEARRSTCDRSRAYGQVTRMSPEQVPWLESEGHYVRSSEAGPSARFRLCRKALVDRSGLMARRRGRDTSLHRSSCLDPHFPSAGSVGEVLIRRMRFSPTLLAFGVDGVRGRMTLSNQRVSFPVFGPSAQRRVYHV